MVKIRALIVDDEPLGRERIRTLLKGRADVELVGESKDGREAVEAIRTLEPDLVFLDVQMPELDGFGVVRAVGAAEMPAVIFVTAYDQHALSAFEVHALDYLLKPFDVARFSEALDRALGLIRQGQKEDLGRRIENLLAGVSRPSGGLDRLMVKSRSRIYFVRTGEIEWIEAAGNYVRLHTAGKRHLLRRTMGGLEAQLDPEQFLRIHRSTIVNLDYVRELRPTFSGEYEVVLKDGTRLTLSRGYRESLERFAP
jgi:two-component system LytT family response regulator